MAPSFASGSIEGYVDLAACGHWCAEDGQKVLLAVKDMGGESAEARRVVLDDLIERGLRRPAFLIVDGAPGLERAIVVVWDGVPVQRCKVHKHRNLLVHAPERLHEEIGADYTDMIYAATPEEIETRCKAFVRKWRLKHRPVADSFVRKTVIGYSPSLNCHRANGGARERRTRSNGCMRSSKPDQDPDCPAFSRNRRHVVLGAARLRPDQHAQGRRLEDAHHKDHRSAN